MNLYPQDLRTRLHAAVISLRAQDVFDLAARLTQTASVTNQPAPHLGRSGRLWARGAHLTEREAAIGLPAASKSIRAAQWDAPFFAAIPVPFSAIFVVASSTLPHWEMLGSALALLGIVTSLSVTMAPRRAVRRLYEKPLSLLEIDALLPSARDDVDHTYLTLMRAAVQQTVPPGAEAGLRDALRALGRAADSLPPATVAPRDTDTLRRDATAARACASQEQDEVVAASWERQADALERQAAAWDRASLVTRRAHVLRAEVLAQMEALQAGLADFRTNAAPDTALLSALSDNAQRVADEASNVAQARAELEEFVAAPLLQESTLKESAVLKNGRE